MDAVANNNHANYWHRNKPLLAPENAQSNCGTNSAFSTVPKVGKIGKLYIFENCVNFIHPNQTYFSHEAPERQENDIKKFSNKSRKHLFDIFNCLQYSEYGLPCFISATWHYDAPETRATLKNTLANFVRELKRKLPSFHAIWKLEYQERGTPHLHFILFPLEKNISMYSPAREIIIKNLWLRMKQCKCKACEKYSINVVRVNNYKMAISYISKEIAKVQDRYEDHDLGRVWGTSENLRLNFLHALECPIEDYHRIVDEKLKENFRREDQKLYLMGIKMLEQNSHIFINHEKIKDIIEEIKVRHLVPQIPYKKYKLKFRSNT